MKLIAKYTFGFVLCLSLSVPGITSAQSNDAADAAYRAVLIELISTLQQQIALLQAELELRLEEYEPVITPRSVGQSPETLTTYEELVEVVASYNIDRPSDIYQISNEDHRDYFARVLELFPDDYDDKLGRVMVFTGEDAPFDAFVETLPPEHEQWLYATHEGPIENLEQEANTELIVHELAHLVSYEAAYGGTASYSFRCESYFDYHGCPPNNSYLREFVDEFWSARDLRRAGDFVEASDVFAEVSEYYEDNEDDFVTEYAAQGPEEDFSESFMYFVLGYESEGDVAEEKVEFFEQYAELREVRRDILRSR